MHYIPHHLTESGGKQLNALQKEAPIQWAGCIHLPVIN